MNIVSLSGRLVKDMEIGVIGQGTAKGKCTIAVERKYQKDYNNKVSDFINLEILGQGIDKRSRLFSKGILVEVTGELNINQYEGKYFTVVKVDNIQPLEFKKKDNNNEFRLEIQTAADDDIPF